MSAFRRGVVAVGALGAVGFFGVLALVAVEKNPLPLLTPTAATSAAERSVTVTDREGRLLRPFATADGRWRLPVTAADVDPRYLAMLVAYEDKRFRSHGGVDFIALARATWQFATSGRIVSGGSTLTMQVARLMEPREGRSLAAKLRQMRRAIVLERQYSKDEILDLYLALAPFGGNLEGVRAASFAYFGKEPRRLSPGEAALLVALPQSPETRRPDRAPEAARTARDRVLVRMTQAGVLPEAEASRAMAEAAPEGRRPFPILAAHAAEAALRERPGTIRHRLTIDRDMQATLERLALERAQALGGQVAVAIVAVEHRTGRVVASVGGGRYLDPERAGALDLTRALRSPGSALKPFIYALAFEEGLAHPETVLEDNPMRFGLYAPENFDAGHQGTVTARRALQLSLNVPAVDLLSALGPARFLSRLGGAGATLALPQESAVGLAVGLGGVGVTLTDLTMLYAGLARGGEVLPLAMRAEEERAPFTERRLTDPVAAWYVADILKDAPPPPNAAGGRIAFKTGTSYGYRDAWALGFDGRHTIGVWAGRPDGASVPGLQGRITAAPILFDAFARLGIDASGFARPADALVLPTSRLPPPLRHRRDDVARTATLPGQKLRIAFPPDGARIEVMARRDSSAGVTDFMDGADVQFRVNGGRPPYVWLVNGHPLSTASLRKSVTWRPNGPGFAELLIIDADGSTDSARIRVERVTP